MTGPFPRDRDSANLRASLFDLLRLSETDTTSWTSRRRRAALESVSTDRRRLTLVPRWLTHGDLRLRRACWDGVSDHGEPVHQQLHP